MTVSHAPSHSQPGSLALAQGGNTQYDEALQPPRAHNEGALHRKDEGVDAETKVVVIATMRRALHTIVPCLVC